jgi:hypothetical protein
MTLRTGRYASPLASQEIANATMAMASGQKIGACVIKELAAQSTQPIIVIPQVRHTASRHRFSGGRFRLSGTLDFRNSQMEKRMKAEKSRTAET